MLPRIPLYELVRQPRGRDLSAAAATQELVPYHGSRGFGFHAETQRGTSDLWALWRFTRSYGLPAGEPSESSPGAGRLQQTPLPLSPRRSQCRAPPRIDSARRPLCRLASGSGGGARRSGRAARRQRSQRRTSRHRQRLAWLAYALLLVLLIVAASRGPCHNARCGCGWSPFHHRSRRGP